MYIGEPAFWGQGFARDAVMTLVAYAFERWDLHSVELWTLADNNRAIEMYRRCGFREDARLPERSWKAGGWVDRVVMSTSREAFGRAHQAWEAATASLD